MKLTKTQPLYFQDHPLPEPHIQLVGYAALVSEFEISAPTRSPMAVSDHHIRGGHTFKDQWKIFDKRYWPGDELGDHLNFALKYETIDLLILKKIFQSISEKSLLNYIKQAPTGANNRRIWYFYEFLTKNKLNLPDIKNAKLIPLIDPKNYFTGYITESKRHKIKNNLLGTSDFCPIIEKTATLKKFITQNWSQQAKHIITQCSPQLIARAASFMLLADSQASFAIEGESPPRNRIERWGKAISQAGLFDLTVEELERLQHIMIGDAPITKLGLRKDGVFLGERDYNNNPLPEFIGARPEDLKILLENLFLVNKKMQRTKLDPVLQATILAFAFVYIHPLEDGNGRLHRYLLHHVLSKRDFTPKGVVFPVSSIMLEKIETYRNILVQHSQPLMDYINWDITNKKNVQVLNETADLYSYFDCTKAAEFIYECVAYTIEHSLPMEITYLKHHDQAVTDLMNYVEMPDQVAKKFIVYVRQNNGKLSKRRREKEFSDLSDHEILEMEEIVERAFSD